MMAWTHLLPPVFILIACLLSSFTSVNGTDLCVDPSEEELEHKMKQGARPYGGLHAGHYSKAGSATDTGSCFLSCCSSSTCDTMFFFNQTCYLIQCNHTMPHACSPVKSTNSKFSSSVLINVRTTDEDESEDWNEDEDGNEDEGENIDDDSDEDGIRHDGTCEVGLSTGCQPHEVCVPRNRHSRSGSCQCEEGFVRLTHSSKCSPQQDVTDVDEEKTEENQKSESVSSSSLLPTSSSTETTVTTVTNTSTKSTVSVTTTSVTAVPTVASTPIPKVTALVVSAGENQRIQLPTNEATLSAFALPKDDEGVYQYQWSLLSQPDGQGNGEMVGMDTDTLKLSKLVLGVYSFKVAVSAEGKYGEAFVNVTVVPPARVNQPPTAVIKPVTQVVNQPNDVLMDASDSTDDFKIVQYHWEQVNGPLESSAIDQTNANGPSLTLKGLAPGAYRFKLTVTDSDGAQNSTFSDVTVIKEIDYPPKANAGSNQIIYLPQNSIILNGNASTDDKGIVSYEWIKSSEDKLIAEMTGVRTPYLKLVNLQVGDYKFTLTVKDAADQSSSADVHVFVKPETNQKPVASAGVDRVVWLPLTSLTLDGSNSTDDNGITSYQWSQVRGADSVIMEHEDTVRMTLTGLTVGAYEFKLAVSDAGGKTDSDTVTLTVKQNENVAPKARAGGNRVVTLPAPIVSLDGSASTDDKGIVSYQWTRTDKSLAAGDILNGTDHQAVLQIANLVAGRYVFKLCVSDTEGLQDTDTTALIVQPEENRNDLIEIQLDTSIHSFTVANQRSLEKELQVLLHDRGSPDEGVTQVFIEKLHARPGSDRVTAQFYAFTSQKEVKSVLPGHAVMTMLKTKITANKDILDFPVIDLDTVVCQNNCSNHGYCDQNTKTCVCEAFWMQNFFKAYIGDESNCDWSVLYVIIISFLLVVALGVGLWGVYCLCKRWSQWRPKKRHRYQLLEDTSAAASMEMLPKGKLQSSSLMVSESDFTSDEETLFINKKTNGHVKNGMLKAGRSKVKT